MSSQVPCQAGRLLDCAVAVGLDRAAARDCQPGASSDVICRPVDNKMQIRSAVCGMCRPWPQQHPLGPWATWRRQASLWGLPWRPQQTCKNSSSRTRTLTGECIPLQTAWGSCQQECDTDMTMQCCACRFMDSGLFQYCRHPNYFGEILVWTSLTALAGMGGVLKAHPWIVASPLFTAFLLIFVSGMPSCLHTPCSSPKSPGAAMHELCALLQAYHRWRSHTRSGTGRMLPTRSTSRAQASSFPCSRRRPPPRMPVGRARL